MDKLVSVIIPVYNLENYIENCLNSIISQTYRNLEILVIDDGSKDRSGEIIREMAEKDDRIVYIYQDNSGVSAARNNGLDRAKGDYIMFADGDDYMHYQAVEILLKTIEEKQCRMVFARSIMTPKTDEKMSEINSYECLKIDENALFEIGSDRAVWNKIFRKEAVSNVRFLNGFTNGEDFNYMLRLLYECGSNPGYRIDCLLYYYYIRDNSASYNDFSQKNIKEILINEKNAEYFSDKNDCYLKSYAMLSLIRSILYIRTKSVGTQFENETKNAARNAWKKWHKLFLSEKNIGMKDKLMFTAFYYCRRLYELARMIQDPTMKDFYKNRKKMN